MPVPQAGEGMIFPYYRKVISGAPCNCTVGGTHVIQLVQRVARVEAFDADDLWGEGGLRHLESSEGGGGGEK